MGSLKQFLNYMSTQHLSEQEIIRRDKLAELTKLGIDAYPAALYPVTHHSADAKAAYEADKETKLEVCVAGRVMSINDKGKVLFLKIFLIRQNFLWINFNIA